jgi:hypothetical protein
VPEGSTSSGKKFFFHQLEITLFNCLEPVFSLKEIVNALLPIFFKSLLLTLQIKSHQFCLSMLYLFFKILNSLLSTFPVTYEGTKNSSPPLP